MAATSIKRLDAVDYPISDGRPMGETDDHRQLIIDLIETLKARYAADPQVYVSGNLLVYYVPDDKLSHLSPDVFVVRGVPKHHRDYYLIWEEGKAPEVVIEVTSRSTKEEDLNHKFWLYRDQLKVKEYFLFDPHQEYLNPPLQGYRLQAGEYVRIRPIKGRLLSKVLGLHLEQHGGVVRVYDPATQELLLTPTERAEQAETARAVAEAEADRLRRELEELRKRLTNGRKKS
jgi:Uma2 family endonuclease